MDDLVEQRFTIAGENSSSTPVKPVKPVTVQQVQVKQPVKPKPGSVLPKEIPTPDKKTELHRQINDYLNSPFFRIPTWIKSPSENASLEQLESVMKQIKDSMLIEKKRMMVDMFFFEGLDVAEGVMTNFLKMENMLGVADAVKKDPSQFRQELEEIAIELDSSYIPSAKTRLAFGLLRFFSDYGKGHHRNNNNYSNPQEEQDDQERGPD